jgi:diguanylate cyclase (GGDEF)-like protein
MPVSYALNTILGSILIIVLIFVNYIRKYNTDFFQRFIFLNTLGYAFIAIIADGIYMVLDGRPGESLWTPLYITMVFYYMFQVAAYYCIFIFIDYITFKDYNRSKRIILAVLGVQIIHLGVLLLNVSGQFYFYIDEANRFFHGRWYSLRLIISYLPAFLVVADVIVAVKDLQKSQPYMIIFFFVLTGLGSTLDIFFKTSLIWACFTSALLYVYFYIIKTDSKIDSLTGIGNRYSFNEFIDKLSKLNTKQSYAVVMIDMDHFKEINDTLGHLEGDNALRDMAEIIKSTIRNSDFAARYGGDEFVLAVRIDYDIEKLLVRLQKTIDRQNKKQTKPYKIEMSYGCDIYTTGGTQSMDEFLKHIDTLMYRHKAERRRKEDNERTAEAAGEAGATG